MDHQELAAELLTVPDEPARRIWLTDHRGELSLAFVQELKAQADGWLARDTRRADQFADAALEAAVLVADPVALAVARWAKGNAHLYLGEYQACLALYRQASATCAEAGLTLETARLRANVVFALTNLGRYDEALVEAALARAELAPYGSTRFLAALEQNAGVAYRHLGRYEDALAAYDRARVIFQALDDPVKAAEMDVNRSKVLENLDDFRQAMTLLEQARPIFQAHGQAVTVARVDLNLGTLLARQGRYREALAAYDQARQGFASLDNRMEAAVVDLYRSNVYLALNLYPEALELATEARREVAGRGMARQVALAIINQATAQRGRGELAEAGALFDEARAIWLATGAVVEVALLDLERAALLRTRGQPAAALALAESALATFATRGMAVRAAQLRLLLADCQVDLGDRAAAERLYRAVLDAPAGQELAALAYRGRFGLGRLAESRGETEISLDHYRQAVAALDAMQRDLRADELRASFLDDKQAVYAALVRVLLALGELEEAFAVVEQAKAGVLLDFLATSLEQASRDTGEREAGLWARLQALREEWRWHASKLAGIPEAAGDPTRAGDAATIQALRRIEAATREAWWETQMAGDQPDPLTPFPRREGGRLPPLSCQERGLGRGAAQSAIPPDTLLLEYFTIGTQIVAFLVSRSEVRVAADFPCTLRELERSLAVLDLTLKGIDALAPEYVAEVLEPACREHLGWFYRALLAPLSATLAHYHKLIVVPHDVLHYLPFHALHDGERYLIETHEVRYLPAAGLLASRRETVIVRSGFCDEAISPALILAHTAHGRLPAVLDEVRAVAANLPAARLLIEDEATLPRLAEHAAGCRLLHLAAHGVFRDDNPLFSYLQLADGPLRLLDVYGLRLAADLVTLSACETGLGRAAGGDLAGLCRGFFAAGARALVVSLWRVDDAATAELMAAFYHQLTAGQSPAVALRAAQLAGLARYEHPYYWAPWVGVGNV
jgi:tetratricopeptide (TPR) repeat protein